MTERFIARIIPATTPNGGVAVADGTKVMVGDVELKGVYKITLIAEAGDIWRAKIECYCEPPEVTAMASLPEETPKC